MSLGHALYPVCLMTDCFLNLFTTFINRKGFILAKRRYGMASGKKDNAWFFGWQ